MLEAIKEILLSLKKTSTDRISNPFYGVFILSWLAFNWEAVAILLFSDMKMDERVRFINSAYPLMFFLPFISSIILTFVLPYCTEKITFFQSRPISRTSSLLAIRRKKSLIADIYVERYRAKKDVAYDRYKVGAEKEVQDMKESIAKSLERTGELTDSLESAQEKIKEITKKLNNEKQLGAKISTDVERLKSHCERLKTENEELSDYKDAFEELKLEREKLERQLQVEKRLKMINHTSIRSGSIGLGDAVNKNIIGSTVQPVFAGLQSLNNPDTIINKSTHIKSNKK